MTFEEIMSAFCRKHNVELSVEPLPNNSDYLMTLKIEVRYVGTTVPMEATLPITCNPQLFFDILEQGIAEAKRREGQSILDNL